MVLDFLSGLQRASWRAGLIIGRFWCQLPRVPRGAGRDKGWPCSCCRQAPPRRIMDEDAKPKLTAAWRAAVARLIEAGYEPGDVYATMIKVRLSFAKEQVNDNPEPSTKARPRTERPRVPVRETGH